MDVVNKEKKSPPPPENPLPETAAEQQSIDQRQHDNATGDAMLENGNENGSPSGSIATDKKKSDETFERGATARPSQKARVFAIRSLPDSWFWIMMMRQQNLSRSSIGRTQ